MKKVLIPTDFSQNCNQTIEYVTKLFKNEQCEFYFLNSYTYNISGLNAIELLQADDDFYDEPKEESLRQLGNLIEQYTVASNNRNHTFYAIADNIRLIDSIKNNIKKIGIDLMILSGTSNKKVGRKSKLILETIRSCPVLIVPQNVSIGKEVLLTIASDFKQRINTNDIDKFIGALENTHFEIGILALEAQDDLTSEAENNLQSLITYLNQLLNKPICLEYIQPSYRLKEYAASHLDGIMCIIDKKPDLFQKMGLYQSNMLSKLSTVSTNTVLTIHQ